MAARQIEMWDAEACTWLEMWMVVKKVQPVPADPSVAKLLCFLSPEEVVSETAAPFVVAERPHVEPDASEEGFRIEAGRNVYHCRTADSELRQWLLKYCGTPTDWRMMRKEYPREIGPGGRYWLAFRLLKCLHSVTLWGLASITAAARNELPSAQQPTTCLLDRSRP